MIPTFERTQFKDVDLTTFQNNVFNTLAPLVALALSQGRLIEDAGDGRAQGIPLSSARTNFISHGLDRVAKGFFVVDNQADARIWRDAATANPASDRLLLLNCSADTTVKLWVF